MVFPDLASITSGQHISYITIFLAIVLSGHLVPFPEDIVLFLAGYIATLRQTHLSFSILFAISVFGPFCADALLYYISRLGGKHTRWFTPKIKTSVMNRISHELHQNTLRTVFVGRFIPGIRLASPLVAGTIKVKPRDFLVASFLGALVYGPLFFLLGYFFHSYIKQVIHISHIARLSLIFIIPTGLAIAYYFYKKVSDEL